ncbi:hypothetical protein [Ekhidna sp.]
MSTSFDSAAITPDLLNQFRKVTDPALRSKKRQLLINQRNWKS